ALLDELTAEPGRAHVRRRAIPWVEQLDLGHELPAGGPSLRDAAEDRFDGLLLFGAHVSERRELREVGVGSRQMPKQIADRADLDALEQLRGVVSDPRQGRDRKLERATRPRRSYLQSGPHSPPRLAKAKVRNA